MDRQLPLPWMTAPDGPADPRGAPASVPALFVRNGRARKYILRVLPDARVRVTIPRYGSRREAEAFLRTRLGWIEDRQSELRDAQPDRRWRDGVEVWWRGRLHAVAVVPDVRPGMVTVRCAEVEVRVAVADDYRPALERAMRRVATVELPRRLRDLADVHGLHVAAVSVRNQRSRWGSCSRDARIALNWRLLQMPDAVCDYVLLHELMHVREPNHSPRFWALVEAVCPAHREARLWLKQEGVGLC